MKNNKIIKLLATSGVILSLGMVAFGISNIGNKAQSLNLASKVVGVSTNTKDSNTSNIVKIVSNASNGSNCPVSSNGVAGVNNSKADVQAISNQCTDNKTATVIASTGQTVNCPNSNINYSTNYKTNTTNPSTNSSTATKATTVTPSSTASDKYIAEIEQLIFNKVNQERAKAGVPQLSYNSTMEHYARFKSQDMGDRGYFDHKNPEGQLITEKMKADGVNYMAWGENIAYIQGVTGNSTLADNFMTNWMNSPGHRANILSTNYISIGIGVYKIGDKYYATQEFYK
ncbi:CAP domain-containing protein [Inconstantimicrobium mannanitabidum]|uniref:Serine protease n=1 Tax=Inconstantimicrobium mannanitabidum TaxID=1604901 RepID=A0ACB5RBV9_9CLOT|nr:CAP domain-containing protein [Clostridium sp. TW13]GKX66742.1 serine protease [Clostridium sp. TW13]